MKLISFLNQKKEEHAGILTHDRILDLQMTMNEFLSGGLKAKSKKSLSLKEVKLLAPIPHPPSCRDAYAFKQHVAASRRNRGLEMIPQFDQYPIFYFTNHTAIVGEGKVVVEKDHLEKLDFELEVACVIGKKGKNIESKDADRYISGFTIMNDLSARQLQMEEMLLNLGPAKGKDFATALGPWLVTPDELEPYKIKTSFGNKYDLSMKAHHNGKQRADGKLKEMNLNFSKNN